MLPPDKAMVETGGDSSDRSDIARRRFAERFGRG
jgi:hypothetical protein